MNFTNDMIREVLYALQHPEVRVRHAQTGSFESKDADQSTDTEAIRPAGRHFRGEPESNLTPAMLSAKDETEAERRLAMVEQLSKEDELHTLTRDYIVAATNQVVRKLERAG